MNALLADTSVLIGPAPAADGAQPLPVEDGAEVLRPWAAARGLRHHALGLLPGLTPVLAEGHGAGTQKAKTIEQDSFDGERTRVTTGRGPTLRPERSAANICAGTLPGGAEGVVAHVVGLVDSDEVFSSDSAGYWVARITTVAVVRVPEAVRVARDLTARPGGYEPAKALVSPGGKMPTAPDPRIVRAGGWSWKPAPAEDPAVVEAAVAPALDALEAMGPGAWIEVHDGAICVASRGVAREAVRLDAMARVASALGRGLREQAAARPELAPSDDFPVRPTEADRAAAEGAARLSWGTPPASLADARAAYASVADGAGRKARRGLGRLFSGAATVATGVSMGGSGGKGVRGDLWALTAFTAAYATSRGLAEQDRHELRRRLPDPPAGAPLRVLRGDIAPGVRGWLALWIDRSDLAAETGYGVLARADGGRSAFAPATPSTLTPELLDHTARRAASAEG